MTSDTLPPRLHRLGIDLHLAATRRVRRRGAKVRALRLVGAMGAALIVLAGAAFAAEELFGQPAPLHVKQDIRGVDAGLPADLRLDPNVESARSVAGIEGATLYYASLKDGGYCTELVLEGSGRGAVCTTASASAEMRIEVSLPYADPREIADSFVVYGRVNAGDAASLNVTYGDGTVQPVPLGDNNFFVFRVPQTQVAPARTEMLLSAVANSGVRVGHFNLTPVLTEAAPTPGPIELSTHTVNGDMTRISGFDGQVSVAKAASLELIYPDGGRAEVPLTPSGSFDFSIPTARFDDFTTPGKLLARDKVGDPVARVWIAAPSYWIGRNQNP
jgi:hypothetical protein